MYKQAVALPSGDTLQLSWRSNYSNVYIYLHDELIGFFPDKAALKLGQRFVLPDGSQITVILARHGLEVWQNGKDLLTGIETGGHDHFYDATSSVIEFGGLYVMISFLVALMSGFHRDAFTIILVGLILAGVHIGLGVWARISGSKLPLRLAFVLLQPLFFILTSRISNNTVNDTLLKGIRTGDVSKSKAQRL